MYYVAVCFYIYKAYLQELHSGSKPSRYAQEFRDNWNTNKGTSTLVLNVAYGPFLAHADMVSINCLKFK